MIDTAFTALLPYLQTPNRATLWLADENALDVLESNTFSSDPLLHIVTNRYDVYLTALDKQLSVEFNDFTLDALPISPERIIYRISKEKSLSHYLLNNSMHLLKALTNGELIISGKKQEGIKTYGKNLNKILNATGKLNKSGLDYSGIYTFRDALHQQTASETSPLNLPLLDDQDYPRLRLLESDSTDIPELCSKPGVFGWNKIDLGSELLLQTLPNVLENIKTPQSVLDLGCGYGWLFLHIPALLPEAAISATDNNAAAIICAKRNAQHYAVNASIVADDCAKHINKAFDLVVCNPPFHQGFVHDSRLTEKFLQQIFQHLQPNGIALVVVNEFIPLTKAVNALGNTSSDARIKNRGKKRTCKEVAREHGFAVYLLQ